MSSIQQYRYDIQRYQNLRNKINTIISKLDSAANYADRLISSINSNYQVNNNNPVISNQTARTRNGLRETSHILRHTILPSIDSSIANANRQIEYLEEEEEERRRQEEEERRRQEEENR